MQLRKAIITHLLKSPMSLAEIQSITKASLPTVRRAVQGLTESHWISLSGQAEANGGRPSMLFGIDGGHYMVFGLHLQLPGLRLIATDLTGKVLKKIDFSKGEIPESIQAIRYVVDAIADIKKQFPHREALGLGIAAPGFVDLNTGDIIAIGRVPSWENFPICKHLSEATDLSVDIANDVDCMAIGEFSSGHDPTGRNFVYLAFSEGIKASLFLNGELYNGTLGNVGLISSNLLCIDIGKLQGKIHKVVTSMGLSEIFIEEVLKLDIKAQKQYQQIVETDNPKEQFRLMIKMALEDKQICYPIVNALFQVLSIATANLIHIIQPDEIVFGGLLSSLPTELFIELEKSIRRNIPSLISNNLLLKKGVQESGDLAAIGATQHFLRSNLLELLKTQ